MSDTIAGPVVTWEEFVRLPDDDRRELIDGVLLEVEVPGYLHEHIVARFVTDLRNWADAHGGGRVLGSGYKIRISPTRGVMPDVQLYGPDNRAELGESSLAAGRPDLVLEVLSPASHGIDRVFKLDCYRQLGVPEYVIIDPAARTLEQLVLRDGSYVVGQSLAGDATFRPASCPGLEIDLAKLWRGC